MQNNNFIPPASVLNAVTLVKKYENEVFRLDAEIKSLNGVFEVDGKKMVLSNESKCKRRKVLNNAKYEFLKRISYYKHFYPENIFNQSYKSFK